MRHCDQPQEEPSFPEVPPEEDHQPNYKRQRVEGDDRVHSRRPVLQRASSSESSIMSSSSSSSSMSSSLVASASMLMSPSFATASSSSVPLLLSAPMSSSSSSSTSHSASTSTAVNSNQPSMASPPMVSFTSPSMPQIPATSSRTVSNFRLDASQGAGDSSKPDDPSLVAKVTVQAIMEMKGMSPTELSPELLQVADSVANRVYQALRGRLDQSQAEVGHLKAMVEQQKQQISILNHQLTNQLTLSPLNSPNNRVRPNLLASRHPAIQGTANPQYMMVPGGHHQQQHNGMHLINGNGLHMVNNAIQPHHQQPPHATSELSMKHHPVDGRSLANTSRTSSSGSSISTTEGRRDGAHNKGPLMRGDSINSTRSASSSSGKSNPKRWTSNQDRQLQEAVDKFDGRNWKAIAQLVDGRDHVQCLQRWKKVLQPGLVKGAWLPSEDAKLLSLIQDEKMQNWAHVAELIEGRTAKQCRERWSLNLDPSINRDPWTEAEDQLLLQLHEKMGSRWAEIKTQFQGRTENAVKTRYKSLVRQRAREWTSEQDALLDKLRQTYGRDWATIALHIPGRSKNAIKVRAKQLACDGAANANAKPRVHKATDPLVYKPEDTVLSQASAFPSMVASNGILAKGEGLPNAASTITPDKSVGPSLSLSLDPADFLPRPNEARSAMTA